jgi:hypothetical protein
MRRILLLLTMTVGFVTVPPMDRVAYAATCTGAASCKACSNCKYCGYCAKRGGKCGVCRKSDHGHRETLRANL